MIRVQRLNKSNQWNRGNKVKSQRLINALLKAKRQNPKITIEELNCVAYGYREAQQ